MTLLRFLRDCLHLTGTKCGCGVGECGACTVIVDGKAMKSCRLKMGHLKGAVVETIEGISKEGLHPLQSAFVLTGAIQCGFCTPGMIMAAKVLLDRNPCPGKEEVIASLSGNCCRCTGYVSILEAVEEASRILRGEKKTGAEIPSVGGPEIIGRSVLDPSDILKATGQLKFAGDLYFESMLHGAALLSSVPHAMIRKIDIGRAKKWPGVHRILTAKDVPGWNGFGAKQADQPVLAQDRVRFAGEVLALVIADTEEAAREALGLIEVECTNLPAVSSLEEILNGSAPSPIHGDSHVLCHVRFEKGNVEEAFSRADVVVEEDYETPFVEHAYMEPEAGVAYLNPEGAIEVCCSTQAPFLMRDQIARCLGLPQEKVVVRGMPAGGAFGGKMDITIHVLLGLGALVTGRPFKMTLTRDESLRMSTKRHPFKMHYKTGVTRDGKLAALEAKIVSDAGAYQGYSKEVLEQGMVFSGGPYSWPAARVEGMAVYTNNVLGGAFRGFGMNQVHFAVESQIDTLARKLSMEPMTLRLMNVLEEGKETFGGERLGSSVAAKEVLLEAEKRSKELLGVRGASQGPKKFGVGVGLAFKSIGVGRGLPNRGGAVLRLLDSGTVELRASVCDMGQGAASVLAQIAAAETGIGIDRFRVVAGDTSLIPAGAVASAQRQTMTAGNAALGASKKFKQILLGMAALKQGVSVFDLDLAGGHVVNRKKEHVASLEDLHHLAGGKTVEAAYEWAAPRTYPLRVEGPSPASAGMSEDAYGEAEKEGYRNYFAYNSACQIALVEVDMLDFRVEVKKILAFHDVGKAINPQKVRRQLEGGIMMGIGYALSEEFVLKESVPQTRTLKGCGIPNIRVRPEIEVVLVEKPDPVGPFSAKGVSEIALVPTVPAIMNAIYDATGVRITSLPARPEKIRAGLKKAAQKR
jgi:CO/xanthine dehydrogenase Mo-binding subunit/aerobic-type carbon monoxide dehydrogenase small subunit (CoxS/CutS family)